MTPQVIKLPHTRIPQLEKVDTYKGIPYYRNPENPEKPYGFCFEDEEYYHFESVTALTTWIDQHQALGGIVNGTLRNWT